MKYKELIEAHGLTLHGDIEHFAELIAAHEREECAKIADIAEPYKSADLIRARGTT
jgi:hypothetical protein